MRRDEIILTCDEVDKLVKGFLDDLLAEEEYQAVVFHIEHCVRCREYIDTIGSLSNHLRLLGNVEVPSDFADTVIFKFDRAQHRTPRPLPGFLNRHAAPVAILSVILLVLIFKIFLNLREEPKPIIGVEVVKEERDKTIAIQEEKGVTDDAGQRDVAVVGVVESASDKPGVDEAIHPGDAQRADEGLDKGADKGTDKGVDEAVVSEQATLHWHFIFSLEEEKTAFLQVLSLLNLDINQTHQKYGLLFFNATGKQLEAALEKIFSRFRAASYLRDFSTATPTLPDKKYQVLVYLENKKDCAIHWHIAQLLPHQRSRLFEAISEMGGAIDYKSGGLITFSIPRDGLERLRLRVQAMRLVIFEFGRTEDKENLLISRPAEVSIYFAK